MFYTCLCFDVFLLTSNFFISQTIIWHWIEWSLGASQQKAKYWGTRWQQKFVKKHYNQNQKSFIKLYLLSMFTHTRNSSWWQELPVQKKVQTCSADIHRDNTEGIEYNTNIRKKTTEIKWYTMYRNINIRKKIIRLEITNLYFIYKCTNFGFYV